MTDYMEFRIVEFENGEFEPQVRKARDDFHPYLEFDGDEASTIRYKSYQQALDFINARRIKHITVIS